MQKIIDYVTHSLWTRLRINDNHGIERWVLVKFNKIREILHDLREEINKRRFLFARRKGKFLNRHSQREVPLTDNYQSIQHNGKRNLNQLVGATGTGMACLLRCSQKSTSDEPHTDMLHSTRISQWLKAAKLAYPERVSNWHGYLKGMAQRSCHIPTITTITLYYFNAF